MKYGKKVSAVLLSSFVFISALSGVGGLGDTTVAHAKTVVTLKTLSTTTTTNTTTSNARPYNSSASDLDPLTYGEIKFNYDNFLEYTLVYQIASKAPTISFLHIGGVTRDIAFAAIDKVVAQNPMLIDVGNYTWHPATSTSSAYMSLTYRSDSSNRRERQQAILQGIMDFADNNFTQGMGTQTKLLTIYNWMDKNVAYNSDAANIFTAYGPDSNEFLFYQQFFSPYGVLKKQTGVCQSYAGVVKLLMDLSGVKNIIVTGNLNGVEHVW